jgi:alpha-tubulin suppressor-like RCC1 family protein
MPWAFRISSLRPGHAPPPKVAPEELWMMRESWHRAAVLPPRFSPIWRAVVLTALALVAAPGCGTSDPAPADAGASNDTPALDSGGSTDAPALDGGGGMDAPALDGGGMDAPAVDGGTGTPDAPAGDGGMGPPRGTGQVVMMPVGAMGATINLESMRLEIPEGVLSTSTMLTVTSSTEAPPAGLRTLAPIYRFGPEGTTFREPITVSFALPTMGTRPRIYWTTQGGSTFEATGTWLQDGRLYARVSHFSGGTVVQTDEPACAAPRQTCMGPCAIPTSPGMLCPLCVNTQTDPAHCGACGTACMTGQACVAGRCTAAIASSLMVGQSHVCALVGGAVMCWGANDKGQLGVGDREPASSSRPVQGLTDAVEISAKYDHTCARRQDGTVWCWGFNWSGQLGDRTSTDRANPVQVMGLTDAVEISAGIHHTCARLQNGTVRCWGQNISGQLGDGTTTDRAAPVEVMGLTDAVQLSAGDHHTCARRQNGTVRCWGWNQYGQRGDGTTTDRATPVEVMNLTNVVELSAGGQHTCARLQNGTVRCWGRNSLGSIGDGTRTNRSTPVEVTGLTDVVELSAGGFHNCARLQNGLVRCWGWNQHGNLGDGSTETRLSPTPVVDFSNAVELSTGETLTCARRSDGSVWCWGYNAYGQVGDGTTTDRPRPVAVRHFGSCMTGQSGCGGACVDTQTDNAMHCGACGNACGPRARPAPPAPVVRRDARRGRPRAVAPVSTR